MSQEQIETLLNDLPRSDEARDRVIEWLQGYQAETDQPDPLDRSGDNMDINSEVGLPPNNKERLGSIASHGDLTDSQNGSTASQGGPDGKGSTASQGGPKESGKGSTASHGGPNLYGKDRQPSKADPTPIGKDRS